MPYPNEHSCRLADPSKFQKDSFHRISAGDEEGHGPRDGKELDIIIAKRKGKDKTEAQAYRYKTDTWTETQAKTHCKEVGGTFEPAESEESKALGEGQGIGGERQGVGGTDWCICKDCGHLAKHERNVPCADMECPECGGEMRGATIEEVEAGGKSMAEEPSLEERIEEIRQAFDDTFNKRQQVLEAQVADGYAWVERTKDNYVIAEQGGRRYRISFTRDEDGKITFGEPEEVEKIETFEPVKMVTWKVCANATGEGAKGGVQKAQEKPGKKKSGAVKFVDDEETILEGLAAPYYGPFQNKDLDGEYFSPETDFCLDWFDKRPLLYQHGHDPSVKTESVGVQFQTWATDAGRWARAQLDKSHRYYEAIKQLVKDGKLFFSSRAVDDLVERMADGHIVTWPWVEESLTPNPANLFAGVSEATAKAHFKAAKLPWKAEQKNIQQEVTDMGEINYDEIAAKTAELLESKRQEQVAVEAKQKEHDDGVAAAAVKAFKDQMIAEAKAKGLPFPVGEANTEPATIKMFSRYDRFSAGDLAMRYMLMKKAGQAPSEQFFRAMMAKAAKLAQEELTVGVKMGQPIKETPDEWLWPALVPFGVDDKGFHDPISTKGVAQLTEIAVKGDELVYSTQSGYGDQWVPTLMAADLWRTIRLESKVLGLFDQFDMPSQPYEYPAESTDPVFYHISEEADEANLTFAAASFPDSKIGTAKVTFSAGKLGARTLWTEEMNEDAVLAIEPTFREKFATVMAHRIDAILISGDESANATNISYYGTSPATVAGYDHYLTIDGIRHDAFANSDTRDCGTLTIDDFVLLRSLMGTAGKYGINPADLVYISDGGVFFKAILMDEVLTLDKMGAMATILNGQLASVAGVPYIPSEDLALTDANGYIDDGGAGVNTQGSLLCINRKGWKVGWKRRPRVNVYEWAPSDAHYIIGSCRLDLQPFEAGMSAYGYNVTIT